MTRPRPDARSVRVQTTVTQTITCPDCGKGRFTLVRAIHKGRFFGPWYCDRCGAGWTGEGWDGGRTVVLQRWKDRTVATDVTLKLPPQTGPVRFIVRGMRFLPADGSPDPDTEEERAEQDRYFYEEHDCPSNWLGCEVIGPDGDEDPHGLFRWVKTDIARGTE